MTAFRKSNVLGRRGKKAQAVIVDKTDGGSINPKWNRVTQLQMKIEYDAFDEFADRRITIEKTLTNINGELYANINKGYTVNIKYDPINPFMMDIHDEYFERHHRARTGCTNNCCITLFTFIVALFFVLIPYWILKSAEISWYWIIIIVFLIPLVMMVTACVSCCVCCKNHDMIAWYKTRTIMKERRRRGNEQKIEIKEKKKDGEQNYILMSDDEFK